MREAAPVADDSVCAPARMLVTGSPTIAALQIPDDTEREDHARAY